MVLMNLFAGQQWRQKTENKLMDTVWEGDGDTNLESRMETYTSP